MISKKRKITLTDILSPTDIQNILKQALITLVGLSIISFAIYAWTREESWLVFFRNTVIGFVLSLIIVQLLRTGWAVLAAYLTLTFFGCLFFGMAWEGAGVRGLAYSLLVLIVIGSGLFIGKQAGYIASIIASIAGIILIFASNQGWLVNEYRPITNFSALLLNSVNFFIAASMIRISLDQLERALTKGQKEVDERIAAETEIRRLNTTLESRVLKRTEELTASQEKHRLRAEEITLLYKLSNSLAAGQNLYNTLLALQTEIINLFPVDAFYVGIYNPETDIISYPIFFYMGEPAVAISRKLKGNPGLTGAVLESGNVLYLPDLESVEVQSTYSPVNDQNLRLHTFLGVPLISNGKTIGMLSVQSIQVDAYSPEQIRLVEAITVQAALAIDKASLLDQIKSELSERQKLVIELEEKNAEMERFTYTVSHDLRSPLVTIKGFLGMLEKDIRENNTARTQSDMQRIASAADKMDNLISELLELSRIGRIVNPPELLDMNSLIHDALETVDVRLRSKNVHVTIQPDLPNLFCDRVRMREVFENLIDNAIKYMGSQDTPVIEIGSRAGKVPVFYVKDNGIGIAPSYHDTVFGLFNKLDPRSEGSGAGLAICKRIIEMHNGRIWVESEGLGKGSTFCFSIYSPPQESLD